MTDPLVSTHGERLVLTWQGAHLTVTFDRWQSAKDIISAEVTITTSAPGFNPHLTAGRLNLTSIGTRQQWAKRMTELYTVIDGTAWIGLMESACLKALRHYRGGSPPVRLLPAPLGAGPSWRVSPLLYEKLPTVIFGPGGSRKSFLGLWLALLVESGHSLDDSLRAVQGRAMYLDWESDADIAAYRMGRFQDGNPALTGTSPLYRRMTQPLSGDLPALAATIAEEGINVLILDSLAMACGGKDLADPSTAVSYFSALRQLPCTSLSIAHVPKNTENPTIYGSIFFTNIARMCWEIKCDTDEQTGTSTIGLFNRKANERRHPPVGLQFHHDPTTEAITVTPTTLTDNEQFLDSAPLRQQLEHYLQDGAKTASQLAALTGKSIAAVMMALNRGEEKGIFLSIGSGKGAEWTTPPPSG